MRPTLTIICRRALGLWVVMRLVLTLMSFVFGLALLPSLRTTVLLAGWTALLFLIDVGRRGERILWLNLAMSRAHLAVVAGGTSLLCDTTLYLLLRALTGRS